MVRLIWITVCVCALFSCGGGVPSERVLFDFESDAELDQLRWECGVLFSLSGKHVTHGNRSLRIELYPSHYPGLNPMLKENDWRGYAYLCFDIFNPDDKKIPVSVRIDDREDYPDYKDRYNKHFILQPGINHMRIPLDTLMTSGTQRQLDIRKIHRLLIFLARPERKVVLYVDYVRLIS